MDIGVKVIALIYSMTSLCGILFNGLLLYLVLYHTPRSLKTYSNLIFNLTLCDLICCIFAFLTQDRVLPAPQSLIFIGDGPCQFISPDFCFHSHNIMVHCFTHALWSALLSFSYRLYILHHPTPKPTTLRTLIFISYVPSLVQLIGMGISGDSTADLKKVLHEYYPQYDNRTGALFGVTKMRWGLIYAIVHVTLPVTPVYIAIVIIRSKIVKHLDEVENMSPQTKLVHKQLLKVLIYQVLLPMLFLIAVVSYSLGALDIYHHPLLENAIMVLTMIPMLSPLVSLYFVRPYSDWISRCIFNRKSNAVDASGRYSKKPLTQSTISGSVGKF